MELEKLAQQIFDECQKDGEPVSMEDALEMAKMEIGAKDIKNYAQATVENEVKKPRKPKTVKISSEKAQLFADIVEFLGTKYQIEVATDNKLVNITLNGHGFKLNLSENRQKKAK